MKIATYTICNNEITYIKDVIDYHLTWVDKMYIMDTGSTDGTLEYLRSLNNDQIIVEQWQDKLVYEQHLDWIQMANPFPEVDIRNHAIKRAEELTQADWIIQLDADSVFLPRTREILEKYNIFTHYVGHSCINPVASLPSHPKEIRKGHTLYDPHVRIWRLNSNVLYVKNPAMGGKSIHCIPTCQNFGPHLFHHSLTTFTAEPIEFHLHHLYGPKFKRNTEEAKNVYSELLPEIFWQRQIEWKAKEKTRKTIGPPG